MASVAPAQGASAFVRFIAPPRAGRAKLRVGVFADRSAQPRWLLEALAKVGASDCAEIAFVAIAPAAGAPSRAGEPLLWRAYRRIDQWAFGDGRDWSEPCAIGQIVPAERRLQLAPADDWRERLALSRLDVAFAVGDVDDAALDGLARFGVWRYCFGDGEDIHEPLAAVHEVIEDEPVVASGLRIRPNGGRPERIACASWSRTFPFSLARSRDGVLPKTREFLLRALRELHAGGAEWLERDTRPAGRAPAPDFPCGTALLSGLARVGSRLAQRTAEKYLTVGQWQLALRFAREEPWSGSLDGFVRLAPPADRFWADPFPLEVNGRYYVFFEELPFGAGKAHISVIEVDRAGRASEPVRVLERDYHLSYPFLVEDEGTLYMIPETAHNRTVEIYRCTEFPRRWKLEKVLLRDIWAVDATLHRAAGRWWMFANVGLDGAEVNDELNVFSADRLLGDWTAHRRNPVRSDVRGARPAGRLFHAGGELYRPGQICTPIYGAGIALHRVTRLDDGDYAEEEMRRIVPAAGEAILGLHTINRAGDLSVLDAFVRRSRFGR